MLMSEILACAICIISYYVIVYLGLLAMKNSPGGLSKTASLFYPASKLMMVVVLWVVFALVGVPDTFLGRTAVFIFASAGFLLPSFIKRGPLSEFNPDDTLDLATAALFAFVSFFFAGIGFQGTPVVAALQIILPAAAGATALSAALLQKRQQKGR